MFDFPYTCINLGTIIETYNESIEYKVLKQAQFNMSSPSRKFEFKVAMQTFRMTLILCFISLYKD